MGDIRRSETYAVNKKDSDFTIDFWYNSPVRLVRIALILAIFLLFGQYRYAFAGDDLKLTISFDKAEYKTSDQIYVDFILKNNGKEAYQRTRQNRWAGSSR